MRVSCVSLCVGHHTLGSGLATWREGTCREHVLHSFLFLAVEWRRRSHEAYGNVSPRGLDPVSRIKSRVEPSVASLSDSSPVCGCRAASGQRNQLNYSSSGKIGSTSKIAFPTFMFTIIRCSMYFNVE
jgi:hypothetical protein